MLCKKVASVRADHVGEQLQKLDSPSLQQTDVALVEIVHKDAGTFTGSRRSLCSGKDLYCFGKHLASKTQRLIRIKWGFLERKRRISQREICCVEHTKHSPFNR
jgi:hypothetical protein